MESEEGAVLRRRLDRMRAILDRAAEPRASHRPGAAAGVTIVVRDGGSVVVSERPARRAACPLEPF